MTDVRPFYDFSLTYLADATVGKVFDVGAAVQFDHLLSVDKTETSPTGNFPDYGYLKAPGDTGYYTFAGTKLMLRFAFDPKRLAGDAPVVKNVFGETGGTIYAEAAILGVKNYPKSNDFGSTSTSNIFGYDDIFQKMPVTVGFDWPTHPFLSYGLIPVGIAMWDWQTFTRNWAARGGIGILSGIIAGGGTWLLEKYLKADLRLDILAVEGEWYGCRYPDNFSPDLNITPVPASPPPDANGSFDNYNRHDDWKWAISAEKTIFGGLSLIGLVGRDHLRTETFIKKDQDYEEALIKNNHLYWMFKIKYGF
jgi:hypothetical protein